MRGSTSLVTCSEALWRSGVGACVGDLVKTVGPGRIQNIDGQEYIDLLCLAEGSRKLNLSATVLSYGPR